MSVCESTANWTVSSLCLLCVCDYCTRETQSSETSLTLSAGCQETPLQRFQQSFSAAGGSFDGRSFHTDDWHCRVWSGLVKADTLNIFTINAAKSAWLSSVFWLDSVLLWVKVSYSWCTRGLVLFLQLLPDKQSVHSSLAMTALRPSKHLVEKEIRAPLKEYTELSGDLSAEIDQQ